MTTCYSSFELFIAILINLSIYRLPTLRCSVEEAGVVSGAEGGRAAHQPVQVAATATMIIASPGFCSHQRLCPATVHCHCLVSRGRVTAAASVSLYTSDGPGSMFNV